MNHSRRNMNDPHRRMQTQRRVEARKTYGRGRPPANNNTNTTTAGTQQHAMTAAARMYAESNGNNSTGSSPRNRGDTRGAQHTHTTHRRSAPMTIVAEGVPGSVELVEQSSSNRFHVPDEDEFDYVGQMQETATGGASSVVSLEAELSSSMDAIKREKNQNRKLRSKIAECERQIKLLQTELDSKKYSHSAKVEKVAAQRDAAMEMVKAKDRDMTELMKAISNNVSAREENATQARKEAEDALVQAREEVTTLVYENKSMKDRVNSAEERSMKLVTDNAEMKVKSSTLEAQLKVETELRGRAEQMESTERNERIAMSAQMLAMAKDHAAKEAKFKGQFEDEILELREKIEADSELMKEKEERLSIHRETITLLEEEKVSLKNALTQKDRTEVNIIEENGQLRGEVAVLKEQLKNSHAKAAEMEAGLNEKICSLEEKIREGEALRRRLHNTIQELRGNVRVYARVRPFLPIDGVDDDAVACITIPETKAVYRFKMRKPCTTLSTTMCFQPALARRVCLMRYLNLFSRPSTVIM
uniref:Spindle pole body-associated protein Vik1/Cik1 microtubule binding domain-containing protein n=1 Tax=Leptocylindrus danicus TaxID=163516 RepID=A0A7S2L2Q0_9STRA|mmetsp:Transcript_29961/g.44020  ORF Transcript_29961/g.44020 Transcript_29961/m.44020 type:complete len:532 (+) Transcript_29961:279-1874(+)